MKPEQILLDVHTHTIASGHAFSSLQEMVHAAADKGLKILGITEHAPGIPGTCAPIYFRNLHVVPRHMYGVELLLGAELNILDYEGHIDLEEFYWKMLDIRIAGIHSLCYQNGTVEQNTAAKETGTLLEINNSSLNPVRHKVKAHDNNLEILRLCKQYEIPVILGSDAHISFSIAQYDHIYPLLQEVDFPDRLIVNDKPNLFKQLLKPLPA